MRDTDPTVAQAAIANAYNGGPEVDQTLTQLVNDPSTAENLKAAAASQLRQRGTDLDRRTEARSPSSRARPTAADGYGGYYPRGEDID